jgi:peptidylprolyl isomerase/FKBP-type peptidyl-prolyl cis-trans isomerase FklB
MLDKTLLAALMAATIVAAPALAEPSSGAGRSAEQAFLAQNAKAHGVVVLPGVQYKILKSGPAEGRHPLRGDDITVRYVGKFLDGKVFNTSPDNGAGTTTFPLQKLIPGWIATVRLMRPGDVWMLYLPAYLAYGAEGKTYIPPDSTLIFQVELVSAGPHVEPATGR